MTYRIKRSAFSRLASERNVDEGYVSTEAVSMTCEEKRAPRHGQSDWIRKGLEGDAFTYTGVLEQKTAIVKW